LLNMLSHLCERIHLVAVVHVRGHGWSVICDSRHCNRGRPFIPKKMRRSQVADVWELSAEMHYSSTRGR
jgi:hypothetical protein